MTKLTTIWSSVEASCWGKGLDYETYCDIHAHFGGTPYQRLNEEEYNDVCNALDSHLKRNNLMNEKEHSV